MNENPPDALVIGYEHLISDLDLPDSNDRHVLAAAIRGRADVIVKNNVKDFPDDLLEEFDIDAQTPDEFMYHLINLSPNEVRNAAEEHRTSLLNPPMSLDEYIRCLQRQGLNDSCQAFRILFNG